MATKHLMLLRTGYSVHLVYELAPNHSGLEGEHPSEIQTVPINQLQIVFQASEERGVRLVGPPPPDGPEPDVAYPIDRGDGTMEIELGWFRIVPAEPGQGPHTVIAQLSIISGGGVTLTGLIVEGMEFRPIDFV